MMMPGPPQSARDLRATLRQLMARLRPEALAILLATVLTSAGVALVVIAPRIIGSATNVIFDGVLGKELPKGMTLHQAEAYLKAHGHGQIAQLLQGTSAV
ncbi:MAG: ABC transporter ATP-binding protein, partial [Candidatus Dormibacteria bacterium]